MTDLKVVVRCVSAEQTPSAPLIEAFEAMKKLAEEVVWFSEKECLAVNTKQNEVIYVFERFEEKEPFNHLSKLGCRIYGPICILNCLKSNKSLPKLPHPVHSLTMEDLIVCCSSIEAAQRAELYKKVSWMCGRGMRNFDDQVSHLVCGEVGSKKYQVAASLKKKLVTPEWVEHLWVKSQSSFVRGDDPQYEARFRCPVFKGLVITVSGIPDRDRVRADIEREGGRYTGDMKLKECTHLIVSEPRGQKYEVAMKWKINIITPQWVEDSLKAGFCMQESKYSINVDRDDRPKTTSTPTGQHTGGLGDTLLHNISSISALNVNETTLAGDLTNISAGLLRKSSISMQANARREEPFSLPDNLDTFLDGCKVALCGFHGPQLELLRKIVNLGGGIRLNDLTDNVTHVVTNKENIASVAKQLEENGWRPHVTGAEWLVDCAKSNEHKSELPYLLYQYKPLAKQGKESIAIIRSEGHEAGLKMQDLQANARKRKSDDNISKDILTLNRGEESETSKKRFQSSSSLVRSDSVLVPRGIDEVVDMETMMSQYLPTNIPTNSALSMRNPVQSLGDMGDSTIMAALGEIAQPAEVGKKLEHAVDDGNDDTISNDKDETKGNNRDVTIADVVDVEMQDEESKLIFKQKTFIMSGFSPEEEADLENEIIECGGQLFVEKSGKGRQKKADYGMVPIICDIQQLPAKEIVTNAWMIMCLEVEKLLPVSGNPIFRPFNIKSGLTCLQGCVLSISGISGVEREALVTLAEALGARYQEYFVHKRVRDLEISTHLIAKEPSGTKYDAAVKWNLPIVSKMWLLECAKEQAHVPEKNFLISSNEHLNESMSKSKVDQPQIKVVEVARVEENSVKENVAQKLGSPYKITSTSIAEKVLNNSLTQSVGGASSVASVVGVTTASVLSSEPKPSELIRATSDKPGKSNEIPVLNLAAVTNDSRPEMANGGTPSASPRQVFRKGLRSKFDVALFQDALQHLDSTAGAKRKSSIGLDVLMESGLRKAIATTSLPMKGTPQPERNNVIQVQKPILHGVVIAVAKKLCAQQSELNAIALQLGADYRWTFDFSCTHFIFQGKTNDTNKEFRVAVEQGKKIVSPHWLYACKEENSRKDEAAYPHTFNPNMALSVISTPARVSTRNSRQKVKESAAGAAKESTADAAKESAASAAKESAAGAAKESAAGTAKAEETNRVKESRPSQSETLKNAEQRVTPSKEDCVEKINSLLETAKARSLRRPSKFVAEKVTTPSSTVAGELSTKSQAVTVVSDMNSRSLRSTRLASVITIESQEVPSETQIGEVVWEDAAARAQQQRLATEHFAAAAESVEESERPVLPLGESIDPLDKVDAILQARHKPVQQKSSSVHNSVSSPLKAPPAGPPVLRTIQPVVTPIVCKKEIEPPVTCVLPQKLVFLFSGMTPQERDLYGALVEQLGGIVSDNQGYDPRCTHLAAGTVVRNEKFLASLAAGKWVMHKSFFEASRECGKFVEESQHEWGGPASMMSLASMGPQVSRMAISAKKWRMKIAETRKIKPSYGGAFDGWQVVLLVDKKKEESFRRLLEAGGAVVHVVKVNAEKWKDISHAFVEPAKLPNEVNYMKAMLSAGVPCLKPEYLAAYLLDEPEPLQNQFLAFPPSL